MGMSRRLVLFATGVGVAFLFVVLLSTRGFTDRVQATSTVFVGGTLNSQHDFCKVGDMLVCSHKGAGFEAAPVVFDLGHARKMILQHGVSCFDIDVFSTTDDVLLIGHPRDLGRPLGLRHGITAETLSYEEVSARGLNRGLGVPPTLQEFISMLKPLRRHLQLVTLEPKGRLVGTVDSIEPLAKVLRQVHLPLALICSKATLVMALREKYPELALAGAISGPGYSAALEVCLKPNSADLEAVELVDVVMPAVELLDDVGGACAEHMRSLTSDLPRQHATRHSAMPPLLLPVCEVCPPYRLSMAWVVNDNKSVAAAATVGLSGIISDVPLGLAPWCI